VEDGKQFTGKSQKVENVSSPFGFHEFKRGLFEDN
jgi:hypothetical protein